MKDQTDTHSSKKNRGAFIAATEGTGKKKKKVKNLFIRNGRFYVRVRVGTASKRIPLLKDGLTVTELTEAKKLRDILIGQRASGSTFTTAENAPFFKAAMEKYLNHFENMILADEANREKGGINDKAKKKRSTWKKEKGILKRWEEFLGDRRLDQIGSHDAKKLIRELESSEKSTATINHHVQTLANLLIFHRSTASESSLLNTRPLATKGLKLKKQKKDQEQEVENIIEQADLNRFIIEAKKAGQNGPALADFIKILAFSGAREKEALRLRWPDVDFDQRILVIGSDRMTKSRLARKLQFNSDLEAHLKDMHARRAPDSEWIFPSPKRGANKNHKHWENPHKVWDLARGKAELPALTRHDLRHYFASQCVMAGIDTMTVSQWLGHQDGGKLVEKLYGNKIPQSHKRSMAEKLTLSGPRIVALPKPEAATEPAAATA